MLLLLSLLQSSGAADSSIPRILLHMLYLSYFSCLTLLVSLSLSHSPCLTLLVSLSLSHSPCLTLLVSLSLSHSPCLTLLVSLSLSFFSCLTLLVSLSLSHSPCLTLLVSLSLYHSPCLAGLSRTMTRTLSCTSTRPGMCCTVTQQSVRTWLYSPKYHYLLLCCFTFSSILMCFSIVTCYSCCNS
jgi:hypothetical protein